MNNEKTPLYIRVTRPIANGKNPSKARFGNVALATFCDFIRCVKKRRYS